MTKEINFLVVQSKKGNQKAQLQLYDLHCKAMYAVAFRYLKNTEEAKDAMQDGFLKAFTNLNSYTNKTNFSSWLKTIIVNTCIDKLKKKKLKTISIEQHPLAIVNDDDWNFNINITKETIVKAIESLPQKYELVTKLFLIDGYNHQEISEILNIPIATSKTHLRRAKLALRKILNAKKYGT